MKFLKRPAGLLLIAACFWAAGCSESGPKSAEAAKDGVAADFKLPDLNGQPRTLQSYLSSHKAVLLNFWATWCPPCREEIPGLINLQKKYGGAGFTVLGVSIGESQVKVASFVGKEKINYPVLLDGDQGVAETYHIVGIPTSYLIGSDGKILGEYHAYTPDLVADVENAIQA